MFSGGVERLGSQGQCSGDVLVSGPLGLSGSSLLFAEKLLASLLESELVLGQSKHIVVLHFVLPQLLLQTFLLWVGHSRADKLPSTE